MYASKYVLSDEDLLEMKNKLNNELERLLNA
jgi:hypothetical protein